MGESPRPTCAPSGSTLRGVDVGLHGGRARPPARRGRRCRSPAGTTSSTRWRRSAAGLRLGFGLRPRCGAGWSRSPAPAGAWSARARSAASGSTTATPTTPTRSPATCRPRGRWPATAGSWWPSSRTWSRAPGSSAPAMGEALGAADEVVVMDVYVAREDPEPGRRRRPGRRARAAAAGAGALRAVLVARRPALLVELRPPGDLVLTLGAGDVTLVGPEVLDAARARSDALMPALRHRSAGRRERPGPPPRAAPTSIARGSGSCAGAGAPLAGAGAASLLVVLACSALVAGGVWLVFFSSVLAVAGRRGARASRCSTAREVARRGRRPARRAAGDRRPRRDRRRGSRTSPRCEPRRRVPRAGRTRSRIEVTERRGGRGRRRGRDAWRGRRRAGRAVPRLRRRSPTGLPLVQMTRPRPGRGAGRGRAVVGALPPAIAGERVDHLEVRSRRPDRRCGSRAARG